MIRVRLGCDADTRAQECCAGLSYGFLGRMLIVAEALSELSLESIIRRRPMNQLVKFHGGKRIGSRAPVGIEEARLVGHVDGIGRRPVAGAAAADDHLGTGGGDISLGGGDAGNRVGRQRGWQ